MTAETYQHSGRFKPVHLMLSLAFGIGLAFAAGVAYAYIVCWIPIIYVSFLATGGLAFAVMFLAAFFGNISHCRSAGIVTLMGAVFAFVALYTAWAFDPLARHGSDAAAEIATAFGSTTGEVLYDPTALQLYMKYFYEEGFWSLGRNGGEVSGIPLAIVWVIEAGIILGAGLLFASGGMKHHPYCEYCGSWTDEDGDYARFEAPEVRDDLLMRFRDGDLSALDELEPYIPPAEQWVQLGKATCPSCSESNYLTVSVSTKSVDKEGNTQISHDYAVRNMVLRPDDLERVEAAAARTGEAQAGHLASARMADPFEGHDEPEIEEDV